MPGIELIAAERERQVSQEGWTPEHDDSHEHNELAIAAVCYASPEPLRAERIERDYGDRDCGCRECDCPHRRMFPVETKVWADPWPWDAEWDKRDKHDRIRRLAIAGALIAAEIDRLQRKTVKP